MEFSYTETEDDEYRFDAVVVGAGHAGIEAGLALARTGVKTLVCSITLDNIGYLACNPSIGGTAKGHLVREVDALGGEMGIAADKCLTQLRMLNASKGPAVRSLRAQVDKYRYHDYMKGVLENERNLTLRQAEVKELLFDATGCVCGVETVAGDAYGARAVILACGVYLRSEIITGNVIEKRGPVCFGRAQYLSDALLRAGITLRRFKTGTPARVKRDTVDVTRLQVQEGEDTPYTFSDMSGRVHAKKNVCYLGYTNERTHDVIRKNLKLSPKYSGLIHGTGARYCPSIEDKIVRFADKDRHQFFLEPEGEGTQEMYVQGISTGLPARVQLQLYRTIEGFERVHVMRDAYAIEYDCIDPTELYPSLMHKKHAGLFFAGQIIGTSGYEEAAALGIAAGINASRYVKGLPPVLFSRESSYLGVMIDDLVTSGADEPYRMMTGRAEYRLLLRQDNADLRLSEVGREVGLVDDRRWRRYQKKKRDILRASERVHTVLAPSALAAMFAEAGEPLPSGGLTAEEAIRRTGIDREIFCKHCRLFDGLTGSAVSETFTRIKYEGYLNRQQKAASEAARVEHTPLPADFDYAAIKGLRLEAVEKLNTIRPLTLGQAARIAGVNPADVNVLIFRFCRGANTSV